MTVIDSRAMFGVRRHLEAEEKLFDEHKRAIVDLMDTVSDEIHPSGLSVLDGWVGEMLILNQYESERFHELRLMVIGKITTEINYINK